MAKRRFKAQLSTIQRELHLVMERMGAISWEIRERNGCEIAVMFVLKGDDGIPREYRYICDSFEHASDNYRAVQKALDYLWRIHENYCVRAEGGEPSMETILKGFRVLKSQEVLLQLPDPEKREAWEILGIPRDATIDEVNNAFRLKAKKMHPDAGGDAEEFKRVTAAKDEMMELIQ